MDVNVGGDWLGIVSDEEQVIVSEHNSLGDNRYFDSASQTSFQVEHSSQVTLPINPTLSWL